MFGWWVITPCVIQARLTPTSSCQVSGETPVVALVRRMRTTWGRATKAPATAPNQPRTSTNKIKTFCSPVKPSLRRPDDRWSTHVRLSRYSLGPGRSRLVGETSPGERDDRHGKHGEYP